MVFAAASLRDVATDLARDFEATEGLVVRLNFAGSNTLAQQIAAAPGADVFLSADQRWVDFLDDSRLVEGSRRPFLRNQLVLIARRGDRPRPARAAGLGNEPGTAADWLLGEHYSHLSLADPEAVPAGRYAKAHLERMESGGRDLWSRVAGRVAPALDVRAALGLVASDPRILGIVYRTDVEASGEVQVLYEFPALDEVPIVYWSARVTGGGATEAGGRFQDFLFSHTAALIARRHGFIPVEP